MSIFSNVPGYAPHDWQFSLPHVTRFPRFPGTSSVTPADHAAHICLNGCSMRCGTHMPHWLQHACDAAHTYASMVVASLVAACMRCGTHICLNGRSFIGRSMHAMRHTHMPQGLQHAMQLHWSQHACDAAHTYASMVAACDAASLAAACMRCGTHMPQCFNGCSMRCGPIGRSMHAMRHTYASLVAT